MSKIDLSEDFKDLYIYDENIKKSYLFTDEEINNTFYETYTNTLYMHLAILLNNFDSNNDILSIINKLKKFILEIIELYIIEEKKKKLKNKINIIIKKKKKNKKQKKKKSRRRRKRRKRRRKKRKRRRRRKRKKKKRSRSRK